RSLVDADRQDHADVFSRVGERNEGEWYRLRLAVMTERLRLAATDPTSPKAYRRPAELADDLAVIDRSLRENEGALLADGCVARVRRLVAAVGFHLATLDIREHSARLHESLDRLFAATGTTYPTEGAARAALLVAELGSRR